ncbi:glucose dehydrogenase [FAD, quinone]-like [Pecten maximus]|uniref:glucose dehydrogenase [FAD, quinone]-like n=1 Tax=Pecten maximus TaxID=6579 RepID=UPI0014590394|nr:glucose dehydrogenase [FAD, quinone]-like [Pecten maximus]XP_033739720.1 glucose dehydrogenase [FAD, quinone]-like [Pecten maximus]XP_033739721.1 glucose dehydrogenase [FAD, quinone]-like [Pecten maximus]
MARISTAVVVAAVATVIYLYIRSNQKSDLSTVTLNKTYDYIIVGAGSTGSVVANRLSEDRGSSVLLLEAGGEEEENPLISVPLAALDTQKSEQDWMYFTEPQNNACLGLNENRSYWPRGHVLGGSSGLNWMVYMRGNRHDYDSWANEGCEGWSYKDVLPYFIKSENVEISEFKTSNYHGKSGPLYVIGPTPTILQEKYIKAGQHLGYNFVDCNGEDQIGFCRIQATIHKGVRWSTYQAFLKPVMTRPNLHVATRSFVTKVIIENKKAVGVELIRRNKKIRVYARKEVILSGGAINTPQLLMLSGIGPKEHLKEMGIPVVADLPVGNDLQDHILIPVVQNINVSAALTDQKVLSVSTTLQYLLLKSGYLSSTALEGMGFVYTDGSTKDTGRSPEIQIHFISAHGLTEEGKAHSPFNYRDDLMDKIFSYDVAKETMTFLPTLLHPKSKGTIRLKSRDPFDHPAIQPNYLQEPDDVKTLISAMRIIERLISTPVLQEIGMDLDSKSTMSEVCKHHTFRSDAFWDCYIRHYTLTVYHPTSTCRMGAMDDPTAVVDPFLRVRGISGLRVADASVMRNVPSANTNAACIMIGEKAADLIRDKDTVGNIKRILQKSKIS